jgi:hypothetical protein
VVVVISVVDRTEERDSITLEMLLPETMLLELEELLLSKTLLSKVTAIVLGLVVLLSAVLLLLDSKSLA